MRPAPMSPLSVCATPLPVKLKFAVLLDSNFRRISHSVVLLGNLSVNLPPGTLFESDSGSCRATATAEGVREATTSSSFAPEERPVCRNVRERSTGLLLFL